jgi:hypothetical protein
MPAFDNYKRDNNSTGNYQDSVQNVALTANGALAINFALGSVVIVALSANATSSTFSGGVTGVVYEVQYVQDGTGSRTVANTATNMRWQATTYLGTTPGSFPTLTTTASKRDSFWYLWDGTSFIEISRALNQT